MAGFTFGGKKEKVVEYDIVDEDEEYGVSVRIPQEHSVFTIDRPNVVDDALSVSALIEEYSTLSAEAKREWHLLKAARDACLNDKKADIRRALEEKDRKKRVTDKTVDVLAERDEDYRELVRDVIRAEEMYNIANGKLSAAFSKSSMLKGLLFTMGKENRQSMDLDLNMIGDLSIPNDYTVE